MGYLEVMADKYCMCFMSEYSNNKCLCYENKDSEDEKGSSASSS